MSLLRIEALLLPVHRVREVLQCSLEMRDPDLEHFDPGFGRHGGFRWGGTTV